MKFIHVVKIVCLLWACVYKPVLGVFPTVVVPTLMKFGSTITVLASAWFYRDNIVDKIPEVCWVHVQTPNYDNLHEDVFGQPLALSVAPQMFAKHVTDPSPKRALMFYFHGASGSGKTHTATMLLNRIYPKFRKNRRSNFIHTFTFTWRDLDVKDVSQFQGSIIQKIDQMLSVCPSSAFIFDEVDNFPPLFKLDFLAKYIDYPSLNGIQHNKAIFILLGNSQGTEINTLFHRKTVLDGLSRNQLDFEDFELDLRNAIRLDGPLKGSELLVKDRIRAIVPFLPLTRDEVRLCVYRAFKEFGYESPRIEPGTSIIDKIVMSQHYDEKNNLYATTGCHTIDSTVEKEILYLNHKKREL